MTANYLKAHRVTGELVWRMEALSFFDEEVTRDLLFVSVHDAIIYIQLETSRRNSDDPLADKVKINLIDPLAVKVKINLIDWK